MRRRAIAYHPVPEPHDAPPTGGGPRVADFVRRLGWVLVEPFVEGRGAARPQLVRALARCRELSAVLVIPSLAQLGADRRFLDPVLAARVRVAALDRPRVGRTTLLLLRDVAAARSAGIAARSRDGLRRARARGVAIGSPEPERGARRAGVALREQADARALALAPWIEEIRLSNPGISLRGTAQILSALQLPTPRGGRWGPSLVNSVCNRIRGRDLRATDSRAT